jgi:hypothetical protein
VQESGISRDTVVSVDDPELATQNSYTFVLVHGGCHDGSLWQPRPTAVHRSRLEMFVVAFRCGAATEARRLGGATAHVGIPLDRR